MQEPGSSPPPVPDAAPADEESRPATVGDVRSLRHWLVVTAVWAVASSAIAVIALVESRNEQERVRASDLQRRVTNLQGSVGGRLRDLQERVDQSPTTEDLTRLEQRLRRVESTSKVAAEDLKGVKKTSEDLDKRLTELEENPPTSTTPNDESP